MPLITLPSYHPTSVAPDTNAILLMHLDGVNNGTTFDDAIGNPVTRNGSPITSTTKSKFGGSSLRLDGSSSLTIPLTTALNLGGLASWTIEMFFNSDSISGARTLIAGFQPAGDRWTVEQSTANSMQVLYDNATATLFSTAQTLASGTWYHLAVVRNGGVVRLYVNGLEATPNGNQTRNLSSLTSGNLHIGQYGAGGYYYLGYLDEVRLSKNVRYTSAFTPPTAPF